MTDDKDLQQLIDRLVDGEVESAEHTDVLRRCEERPDGWRMMALSLLEARELSAALRELTAVGPATEITSARATPGLRLLAVLALACTALVAFSAGRMLPPTQSTQRVADDRSAADVSDPQVQQDESDVNSPHPGKLTEGIAVVGVAQIHHPAGAEPPVPVIGGPDLDHREILSQPAQIPEQLRRQYRNRGLSIQRTRRVMSLELADGQRFAIPLDKLGVRYVGHEIL